MRKIFARVMLVTMMLFMFVTPAFATGLDDINRGNTQRQQTGGDSGNDSVTDYLRNYKPITNDNMATAQKYASPITVICGNVAGMVVILTAAWVALTTVLDLLYIGVPFVRPYLNPSYSSGGGGGGMGMPMPQPLGGGGKHVWVSDEAVACLGASSGGSSGGMGMGMGMGGMGMGGMGGGGQQTSTKSVITQYFKKRVFFLVIFAVATILLTSSVFTDCGINLAELSFKVLDKVNAFIASLEI